jgi:hypothetical protein
VKVLGLLLLLVVVAVVVVLLVGGGEHGPGRHFGGDAPARDAGEHTPPPGGH